MNIEPADPIPQVSPWFGPDEIEAVGATIARNWITEGPACKAFHDGLLELMQAPFGVFAPNGTLALALALMALDLQAGDEVLVPDTTFFGSATAVLMAGGTPVFVDVETDTYQIDLQHARESLTARTRAIMPVHLYGTACDMDAMMAFAQEHRLQVIEDAAQGIGVGWRERHVGTFGDVGCFSFFADKTITTGEGGFVVCRDPQVYDRLRHLRNQGRLQAGSFVHPEIGFNFRMTDMQGALGVVQLRKLPQIIARKRDHHQTYARMLADVDEVRLLGAAPGAGHVPFRAVLIADRVQALMAFLEANGIQSRSFFYPMHRQPSFVPAGEAPETRDPNFPGSVHGYAHGVCLPISPALDDTQIRRVAETVKRFYAR